MEAGRPSNAAPQMYRLSDHLRQQRPHDLEHHKILEASDDPSDIYSFQLKSRKVGSDGSTGKSGHHDQTKEQKIHVNMCLFHEVQMADESRES